MNIIDLRCETYVVERDREGRGYNGNIFFSAMLETALQPLPFAILWQGHNRTL